MRVVTPRLLGPSVVLGVLAALLPVGTSAYAASAPAAPTDGTVSRAFEGARTIADIAFTPGADAQLTDGYEASLNGSDWLPLTVRLGADLRPVARVTGLSSGAAYTARVRSVRDDVVSDGSDASAPTTTAGDPPNLAFTARAGDARIDVVYRQAEDTSEPVGYAVAAAPASGAATTSKSCDRPFRSCSLTGLVNDSAYDLVVGAFTEVSSPGQAEEAGVDVVAASRTVEDLTPSATPRALSAFATVSDDRGALLRWRSDTGEPLRITGYQARVDGGAWRALADEQVGFTHTASLRGLVNGRTHRVAVRAVYQGNPGPATVTRTVRPAGTPGRPRAVTVRPSGTRAKVAWRAPVADGGSKVRFYLVTTRDGLSCRTTTRSCTVGNLVRGTRYAFTVRADNTARRKLGTGLGARATSRTVRVGG